jgi:hypothetical protein
VPLPVVPVPIEMSACEKTGVTTKEKNVIRVKKRLVFLEIMKLMDSGFG